jgi:myo-inositol-1(or 4)-monophosphatase
MHVMQAAAIKAGKSLKRDFARLPALGISRKKPGDYVSDADRRAEEILFQELSKARPGYGFLMEEGGTVSGSDISHRFIIDPLDGTTNFLHGIAHFSISLALEREGELVAGIVYNPISEEMFIAEKGKGAFAQGPSAQDNYRLRVSACKTLDEALIATGIPFLNHGDPIRYAREIAAVMAEVAGIRRFGSAALDLAFVAAGRFDAFWERGLSAWDVAGGLVLVREAGGFATAIDGDAPVLAASGVVAGCEAIHDALRRKLLTADRES